MEDKLDQTRQQKRAQAAYKCVSSRKGDKDKEYSQLSKRFPALVHNCGLAQATAFVQAKEGPVGGAYLANLSKVMGLKGDKDLGTISREAGLVEYQRLTREAIESGTWLKRYSEALLDED
jgi:CRISPR-associated protein Cmr5